MSGTAAATEGQNPGVRARVSDLVAVARLDGRVLGLISTLILIEIGFGIYTGGEILSPVNLLTFATQAVEIAIIATAMVLVIVSRNIDLSVGSVLAVCAMTYAVLTHEVFPSPIADTAPARWLPRLA